jgi:ketosteroid isomerase-like protein
MAPTEAQLRWLAALQGPRTFNLKEALAMRQSSYENRLLRLPLLLVVILIGASTAGAQPAKPTAGADPEQEVREVNDRRFAAMVRADTAELGRLLADDLTYTHSTGVVETKEQFLAAISSQATRYRSIEPSEVRLRVYGDAAVVTGKVAMQVSIRGQDLNFTARFTAVYARLGGAWKLVAWQTTRLPEG